MSLQQEGDCTSSELVVYNLDRKFQLSGFNKDNSKGTKIIDPLQALGAKGILIKLLRIVQKHADKEGCKHCEEILEVIFM